MSTSETTVLRATYLNSFSCIGSACEDTCCIGWTVIVDQSTYEKYQTVEDPTLQSLMADFVRVLDDVSANNPSDYSDIQNNHSQSSYLSPSSDQRHAMILWKEGLRCPMLDEEKLCTIQKTLGEDALSTTCSNYPREYNQVDQQLELSANMSCPEIARLALLNPNGIEFEYAKILNDTRFHQPKRAIHPESSASKTHFWPLRIFTIEVLQNRQLQMNERLLFLDDFYRKLQPILEKDDPNLVIEWLEQAKTAFENGSWRQSIAFLNTTEDPYPAKRFAQRTALQLVNQFVQTRMNKGWVNERFVECYVAFLYGIGAYVPVTTNEGTTWQLQDLNSEDILEQYVAADEAFFQSFMNEHAYLFENYLVNHVFKQLFPFEWSEQVSVEFAMLALHYVNITTMAKGMAVFHGELHVDAVLKLIQSYAKTTDHHKAFQLQIREDLVSKLQEDPMFVTKLLLT